ncbi:MAG: hypothetical protein R3292_02645 [Alcanivorax sp.]|nr:hypothetical protein [Alcanivorax sp.]
MSAKRFDRVWEILEEDTRGPRELELRSKLLMNLQQGIRENGWGHQQVCQRLGLSGRRAGVLLAGKVGAFALAELMALMRRGGIRCRASEEDQAFLDILLQDDEAGRNG